MSSNVLPLDGSHCQDGHERRFVLSASVEDSTVSKSAGDTFFDKVAGVWSAMGTMRPETPKQFSPGARTDPGGGPQKARRMFTKLAMKSGR